MRREVTDRVFKRDRDSGGGAPANDMVCRLSNAVPALRRWQKKSGANGLGCSVCTGPGELIEAQMIADP
jgi:hypothetical protein